jgi:YidC/Oxa1 family membrane protein insertase
MGGFLAKIIGYVMQFIYSLVNNYGLSIIILTFLVRLCLLPLYNKQNKYTAAMADLQPKINDIQTRYAADRNTMNEKLNEVYAEAGISPLSGCLPMLIQLPIILGLFALLRNPLTYMSGSEMAAAVHESFLWVSDLSQPDSWILPLLAGITTYFSTASTNEADGNSMAAMKYFFPVMLFLLARTFPSGLALYWAVGNFFTMLQTYYFMARKKKKDREKEIEEEVNKRLNRKR